MYRKYRFTLNQSKRNYHMVTLEELNQKSSLYFSKVYTENEVLNVVNALASGRISTPLDYIPFREIILKNQEQKEELMKQANRLFNDMIFFVKPYNEQLYQNAYFTKKYMATYHKFIQTLKSKKVPVQKKVWAEEIDCKTKRENILFYLLNKHDAIVKDYLAKEKEVSKNDIVFARTYEKIFKGQLSMQHLFIEQILTYAKTEHIPILKVSTNENYNLFISYFNFFEEKKQQKEQIPKDKIHKMENLQKEAKRIFGNVEVVIMFRKLIQSLNDYNVYLTLNSYNKDSQTFHEFCTENQLSFSEILTRLERMNEIDKLTEIKEFIKCEQETLKNEEEKQYQQFVSLLTSLLEQNISMDFFTLAHYYSLTTKSLKQMVRMLEKREDYVVLKFMQYFLYTYGEKDKSYLNMKLSSDFILYEQDLHIQINKSHFPRKIAIYEEAINFAKEGRLQDFTKEYFIEDIKQKLLVTKEDEKVQIKRK